MAQTAADVLVETLMDWGVDTIFGLPGDGINGIIEALRIRQDKIKFIQVRHEESAAFMACGYAKYTGKLGVCLATSGPGGIHLLNGLYDAKMDGAPVLAITGMQYHDVLSTRTQQDVELDKLFMDVAEYSVRAMGPEHIENITTLACRTALARKGVAHITVPVDFQHMPVERKKRSMRNVEGHVSHTRVFPSVRLPTQEALQAAADILNASKKPVILCGRGALNATDELIQTADKLGAPIVKALLGKAAVPDDCDFTTGGVGLLGTAPSQEALEACDCLFIIGSSFPYVEFYPKPDQSKCVQIDDDPSRIGLRYPAAVGLVGDAVETLQALLPLLKRNERRGFLENAQSHMKEWRELMRKRGTRDDMPMKPQVVAYELSQQLPVNAVVSADSGTNTTWFARQIDVKRGQKYSVSGTLASMACGLPYAIAAAVAFPDRPSIAFVGDGGLSMLMAEIATAVKYKLNVKIFVIKNNALGQIKWEQIVFLGNPEYVCDLEPIDFAAVARACGAQGFSLSEPTQAREIIARALATPGPVLVEALVDPNEAPIPGKITLDQAMKFSEAILRGTKDSGELVKTFVKDKFKEMVSTI